MENYDNISELNGIGIKYSQLLKNIGIKTIEDLLTHIPYRYEDRSNITKISDLKPGETSTVFGVVLKIDNVFTRNRKKITKAIISDETGKLNLIWFNQHYIKNSISEGSQISISGKLDLKNTSKQFVSPQWEIIKNDKAIHTTGIVPIYSVTAGISPKWLRNKINETLEKTNIPNLLTEEIIKDYKLSDRNFAFQNIHFPKNLEDTILAKKSLSFEEMIFLHLKGIKLRNIWQKKTNSHQIKMEKEDLQKFKKSLPFELTNSQQKAIDEILSDLSKKVPMNRLLQGDVGSGKTVVAAASVLAAAQNGFNTIFLAPTQILANQHQASFRKLLPDLKTHLITSETSKKLDIGNETKTPTLYIGTHAILHNLDKLNNIALIIIDEQHKFGVGQRTNLVDFYTKKLVPNVLTMTATPIPRSMALTFYGDLDLTTIDELPKGKVESKTWIIEDKKRKDAYNWIKKQINESKTQTFIVCPFIEKSEVEGLDNVKSAVDEFKKVSAYFKEFKIGLLHGKMKNQEKDKVIDDFSNKKIDILVTTPLIEVGIDIPNANIIVIETPERFGLASLHQLRGRVGRGDSQSYCILIPSTKSHESIKRLSNLKTVHNGNKLAEIDMQIRGPGNIYGTEQHGFLDMQIADISDIEMVRTTKKVALDLFENISKYQLPRPHGRGMLKCSPISHKVLSEHYKGILEKLDRITYIEDN
ncbi:ATP-dependent DNA helicase RecG [candidate division WWE3 bacterium CG_4_9_14_0_2_um_filter_35_11]|uniref:Probable DNA 3'-5' helicase RecG n=1 Tax=candidate division WWE3 bacterium CG_4_9_14_0_2_um_filter_35_11 TaxID=1975077 RepID=A0A2M8EMA6_UNCKA|nr:MAG: ATP-dependent DNA helicase RecG [candidate division WWE3 bacterium CG10_big_fil_rev_8_21_14_0_10_35_32]PJC23860.1 MAG: ATP-dependent DNA helicase RecG [candidate division WWE3 bacterium CG_4_9_14_0_2_um_filter_35_11]